MSESIVACSLVMLVGCTPAALPDPQIVSVSPDAGWQGRSTVLTVEGSNFLPYLAFDASERDALLSRGDGYSMFLVGPSGSAQRWELTGATILASDGESEQLQAVVRSGWPVGLYDVEIVGPTGRWARADNSFTVTANQADHLAVIPSDQSWSVGTTGTMDVVLEGIEGEEVQDTREVIIEWTTEDGGIVSFDGDTLADSVRTGNQIQGVLQLGRGSVFLRRDTPGQVRVTSRTVEPEGIASGTALGTWSVGEGATVGIELPEPNFEARAGEPFSIELSVFDDFGNLLTDQRTLLLSHACGNFQQPVLVAGTTMMELTLTRATGVLGCQTEQITTGVGDPPGASAAFNVRPGPIGGFNVLVANGAINAGEQVAVVVTPIDAFGNRTMWAGDLLLTDDAGDVSGVECSLPPGDQFAVCLFSPSIAGENITLTASALVGANLQGTSAPYSVSPGLEAAGLSLEVPAQVVAGETFSVFARFADAFGNAIVVTDSLPVPNITDGLNEMTCVDVGFDATGAFQVDCELYTAGSRALQGEVSGVDSPAVNLEVINGPLGIVQFSGPTATVAGDVDTFTLVGLDAFSNPYLVATNGVVDIQGDRGWNQPSVTLGADGTGQMTGSFFESGPATLVARQDGVALGDLSVQVNPGPASTVVMTFDQPWTLVNVPTNIRVDAADQWGNRADYDGVVSLESALTGDMEDAVLTSGVGFVEFIWTSPVFGDQLSALGGPGPGLSAPIDVVNDCATTPVVSLTPPANGAYRSCLDAQGQALIALDFSSSTATNTAPLAQFLAYGEEAPAVRAQAATPSMNLQVEQAGRLDVYALAMDEDFCYSMMEQSVWVGADNGSVTGPVELTSTGTQLGGLDAVTISAVGAMDCAGDLAEAGTLWLRTALGDLDADLSGQGLSLVLDATGGADALLTTSDRVSEGDFLVVATNPEGTAGGQLLLSSVDDAVRPTVWSQEPVGEHPGPVDKISILFSEPMLNSTLVQSNFQISGPLGPLPSAEYTVVVVADNLIELHIAPPLDGLEYWSVTATSGLRDQAGNLLAGEYDSSAMDYVGWVGGTALPVDDVLCSLSPEGGRFRPDGDPGVGADADVLTITGTSGSPAVLWTLLVTDEQGDIVVRSQQVPAAGVDFATWDGRDAAGFIVNNGTYSVHLSPSDSFGNQGVGCVYDVEVDNWMTP